MAETRSLRFLIAVLGILGAAALFAVVILRNRQVPEGPSAADDSLPPSQAPSDPNPAALPPKPELVEDAGSEDDSEPMDGDGDAPMDSDDMRTFIAGLVRPWNPDAPVEERLGPPLLPDLVLDLPRKRPAPVLLPDDGSGDVPPGSPPTPKALVQDKQSTGRRKEEDESDSSFESPLSADAQNAARTAQAPSPLPEDPGTDAPITTDPAASSAARPAAPGTAAPPASADAPQTAASTTSESPAALAQAPSDTTSAAAQVRPGSPEAVQTPQAAPADTATPSQPPSDGTSDGPALAAQVPSGGASASAQAPSDGTAAADQAPAGTASAVASEQARPGSPEAVRTAQAPSDTAAPSQASPDGAPAVVQVPSDGAAAAAQVPPGTAAAAVAQAPADSAVPSAQALPGSPDEVRTAQAPSDITAPSQASSDGAAAAAQVPSGTAAAGTGQVPADGASASVQAPVDAAAGAGQVPSDTASASAQALPDSPDEVQTAQAPSDITAPSQASSDGAAAAAQVPSAGPDAVGTSQAAADGAALSQVPSDGGAAAVVDASAVQPSVTDAGQAPSDAREAVQTDQTTADSAALTQAPGDTAAPAGQVRPGAAAAAWRARIARSEPEDAGAGAAAAVDGGLESAGAAGADGAVPADGTVPSALAEAGAGAGDSLAAVDAQGDRADVLPEDVEAGALVIASPVSGGFYSSQVTVSGEAPGFTELAWRSRAMSIDGVIPLDEQSGFEFTVNTFGFNGELDIAVSGRDADGELRGSLIELINNRTGPSIELDSPLPGDYFTDYVEVAGRLRAGAGESSNTGEAESLSWSVDEGDLRSVIFGPDGGFTFQVSMPRYEGNEDERPTDAQLTLLARDLNGNITERRIPLIDGRLTPGLAVTGPINDSEYGAGVSLRGRVSDPYSGVEDGGGIQSVRYEILSPTAATRAGIVSGEITVAADGSFDFPIFTGDLSGDQDISVIVTGNNGRQTVETLRLRQGISAVPDFAVQSGDSAVNVSWGAIPSASEYAVRISDPTGDPVRYIVSGSSAQLGGLVNGFEYNFQLEAVLPAGEVESHQVSTIPLAPDTLQPDVIGEFRRIRVSWNEIPGSDAYAVFRAESEEGPYELIAEAVSGNEFIDTRVRFGGRYWYAVAPAAYSDIVSAPASAETLSVQGSSIELLARLQTAGPDSLYIQGEYAFAASSDQGLLLVDIAEAVRPVGLSRTEIENAVDVAVRESYAYVAAGRSGLSVVNIEDPANPILVGSEPAGNAAAVSVSGNFAYVADLEGGLRVLDVSSSREPKRVASSGGLEGRDVQVSGKLAYLAAGSGGILIYDVSVPSSPRVLSSIAMDGAERILLNEDLLIAGGLQAGINIYDVKDPAEPRLLSQITQVGASQLDIAQGFLLAGTSGGLILVDIRDPAAPLVFETYSIPDSDAMAMAGDKLLIADRGGIDFYQTHFLGNAFITAALDTEGRSYGISNFARNIYVSSHTGGVAVVDSNTLAAQAVYATEFARAAAADENNIYVADGYAGVRVIRVGQGGDIIFEGNGFVNDVAVLNDTVYAASEDGLVVLSTAGGAVRRVGTMNVQASRTLATDGVLLFAGGGDSLGLFVPVAGEMPFEASAVRVDGIRDVTAQNNTAAAVSDNGVLLFQYNASERRINPAGEITVANAESVTLNDGYLYISAGYRGLLIYDIRNIESPKLISVGTDMFAVDTVIVDDTAFLVDGEGLKSLSLFVPPWLR